MSPPERSGRTLRKILFLLGALCVFARVTPISLIVYLAPFAFSAANLVRALRGASLKTPGADSPSQRVEPSKSAWPPTRDPQIFDTGGAQTSFLSILGLTHGSHRRVDGTAFR